MNGTARACGGHHTPWCVRNFAAKPPRQLPDTNLNTRLLRTYKHRSAVESSNDVKVLATDSARIDECLVVSTRGLNYVDVHRVRTFIRFRTTREYGLLP